MAGPDNTSVAAGSGAPTSTLGQRVSSALALIIAALVVTYIGGWPFALWVAGLGVLIMLEWQAMTGLKRTSPPAVLQSAVVVTVCGFVVAGYADAAVVTLLLGIIGVAIAAKIDGVRVGVSALGVLAIGLPAATTVGLRGIPGDGMAVILWLFAVVWASDSGAYSAGRLIGGPHFAAELSPNKTWAGVIGGFAAALIGGSAAAYLLFDTGTIFAWIGATAMAGLLAQAGDIAESAFKRRMGVKDSGKLIPGHGGVLDRMDAFLMASAGFAVIAMMFGDALWPRV